MERISDFKFEISDFKISDFKLQACVSSFSFQVGSRFQFRIVVLCFKIPSFRLVLRLRLLFRTKKKRRIVSDAVKRFDKQP